MEKPTTEQRLKNKISGMMQTLQEQAQAEAQLLPPAIERLDQLQALIQTMQNQLNTVQQQCQKLLQASDQQAQRIEEQRALLMKIGQIATRTEKFLKEKKPWKMPWSS